MTDIDIWGNPTSDEASASAEIESSIDEAFASIPEFASIPDSTSSGNSGYNDTPEETVGSFNVAEEVPEVNPEYENAKEKFAELVKTRRNNAISELQESIESAQTNYEDSTRRARSYLWTLNDLRNTERSLQQVEETKEEALFNEFDGLLRHEKVNAVGIRDDQILIKTNHLTVSDPDGYSTYDLGEFEIVIPTTSRRAGSITLNNRTNARQASDGSVWHHPHVLGDNPCFGAIEEQLITALAQGEYGGAFELLLQYLQTYNPEDSYGDNIALWGGEANPEF